MACHHWRLGTDICNYHRRPSLSISTVSLVWKKAASFYDGVVAEYTPSIWEILLGIGGTCIALLVVTVGVAVLDFLPESLSDKALELNSAKSS